MAAPTWPVFLVDGHDVAAYADAAALTSDVEAWMADQPVALLDAEARPLRLQTSGDATLGVELTGESAVPERLRAALTYYIGAVGVPVPDAPDVTTLAREAARIINGDC